MRMAQAAGLRGAQGEDHLRALRGHQAVLGAAKLTACQGIVSGISMKCLNDHSNALRMHSFAQTRTVLLKTWLLNIKMVLFMQFI